MPETSAERFHKAAQWEPNLEDLKEESSTCFLLAGFFHGMSDSLRPLSEEDKPFIEKASDLLLKLGRLLRKEMEDGQ